MQRLGGQTTNHYVLFLLGVAVFNLIDQIGRKLDLINGLDVTLPFVIVAIIIYIVPFRKIIISYIILLLGIAIHYKMEDHTGYSSLPFFFLAYSESPNKRFGIVVVASSFLSIVYKSAIANGSPTLSIIMILVYGFIFYALYKNTIAKIQKPTHERIESFTENETSIAKGMASGVNKKKIFSSIGITEYTGYALIKKMKKKLGVNSTEEITYNLRLYNDSKNRIRN